MAWNASSPSGLLYGMAACCFRPLGEASALKGWQTGGGCLMLHGSG